MNETCFKIRHSVYFRMMMIMMIMIMIIVVISPSVSKKKYTLTTPTPSITKALHAHGRRCRIRPGRTGGGAVRGQRRTSGPGGSAQNGEFSATQIVILPGKTCNSMRTNGGFEKNGDPEMGDIYIISIYQIQYIQRMSGPLIDEQILNPIWIHLLYARFTTSSEDGADFIP